MAKRVGIITFHASHNYGSMLQAYALQRVVTELGYDCEIINFRTAKQKNIYRPFFLRNDHYQSKRWKLKAIAYPILAFNDIRKYNLFEKFIKERMRVTTKTYSTFEELESANLNYDTYISGSDQIWNTACLDFDKSYYLGFVKSGKKIAYAPSMGPVSDKDISVAYYPMIKDYVKQYDSLSVREEGTAKKINEISGLTPSVMIDPTLLVKSEEWSLMARSQPMVKGEYIFLYTPRYDRDLYVEALKFAKKNNLKIVVTIHDCYGEWKSNKYFKFVTAVGPIEFLNLIKFSKFVISGSFHAVVFSILFSKSFYAYKGMDDSRISTLLEALQLQKFAVRNDSLNDENNTSLLKMANERILPMLSDSIQFLVSALK